MLYLCEAKSFYSEFYQPQLLYQSGDIALLDLKKLAMNISISIKSNPGKIVARALLYSITSSPKLSISLFHKITSCLQSLRFPPLGYLPQEV